jgi:hypothetical protein
LELIHNLGFRVDKDDKKDILTDEQIKLVEIERKKIKDDPAHFIRWDDARRNFKLD